LAQSALFDSNVGEDRKLKFMLSTDGLTLYGLTQGSAGDRFEQMSLKSTTIIKPPPAGGLPAGGLPAGGLPAGTVPAASGTKPASGLFRPVTP